MADLFTRLADRARGETGALAARVPTRFEPPAPDEPPQLEEAPGPAPADARPGAAAQPAASVAHHDVHVHPVTETTREEHFHTHSVEHTQTHTATERTHTDRVMHVTSVATDPVVSPAPSRIVPSIPVVVPQQAPASSKKDAPRPVVHISIGRIEVRHPVPPAPPQPAPVPVQAPAPVGQAARDERLSLADYLRGNDGRPA